MPSYHFDVGDSNDGPIGLCIRVDAASREEAEEIIHSLPMEVPLKGAFAMDTRIEYATVYINTGRITQSDIDEEDDDDADRTVPEG